MDNIDHFAGIAKSIVSIHGSCPFTFDTFPAGLVDGSGFIVDIKNGLILTNRHITGSGAFRGYVHFNNDEECDVSVEYIDPIHDFAFLRFRPEEIKTETIAQLELRPDLARVGLPIHILGNNNNERLGILSGVISRTDRNPLSPDFNIHYIQVAAAATHGSSGSPAVTREGHAVALVVSGSSGTTVNYLLSLDIPLRVLKGIQEGQPITRGTMQATWRLEDFAYCAKLGLNHQRVDDFRKQFPDRTRLLVAGTVLPDGPAHVAKVRTGDILIRVNGALLSSFIELANLCDSNVGGKVQLLLQREGHDVNVDVDIADLRTIIPNRVLFISGAIFHQLSLQQAMAYAISLRTEGAYACSIPSYLGLGGYGSGVLIQNLDNKPTPNLEALIDVFQDIPDCTWVPVTFKYLGSIDKTLTSTVYVDRYFHESKVATRSGQADWTFANLPPAKPPTVQTAQITQLDPVSILDHPKAADVVRNFVSVSTSLPFVLDGYPAHSAFGYGLVVDASLGLVLVSRAFVPQLQCIVSITIGSVTLNAKPVFLHPLEGYAFVQYDSSRVKAPFKDLEISEVDIERGASGAFVGFEGNQLVWSKSVVVNIVSAVTGTGTIRPQYRVPIMDEVWLDTSIERGCSAGALVSDSGVVLGFWLARMVGDGIGYSGISIAKVLPILRLLQEGKQPDLKIFGAEVRAIRLDQARIWGVEQEWLERIETERARHQIFQVTRAYSELHTTFKENDIILEFDDNLVTEVRDLDIQYQNDEVRTMVVRDGGIVRLDVRTISAKYLETEDFVFCCGLILQRPHHAVRQQIADLLSDVYVSFVVYGSPGARAKIRATDSITHVNGVDTPDLDSFLDEVAKIPQNTYFRVRIVTLNKIPWITPMRKDEHYFPTRRFRINSKRELE